MRNNNHHIEYQNYMCLEESEIENNKSFGIQN